MSSILNVMVKYLSWLYLTDMKQKYICSINFSVEDPKPYFVEIRRVNSCCHFVSYLCPSVSYRTRKDWNIQNCNFIRYYIWVWGLIPHFTEKIYWGHLRTECWGGNLDLRRRKQQKWGKELHYEELLNLNPLPNMITVIGKTKNERVLKWLRIRTSGGISWTR